MCEPDVLHNQRLFQIEFAYINVKSRGSTVDIVTDYGMDDREAGVRVPIGSRIFTSLYHADRLQHLPIQGHRGVKMLGREDDHSPLTSAEVFMA
jgi:hypothetical protein